MNRLALLPIAALPLLSAAPAAAEKAACATRTEVLNHLSSKYAETPVAMGMASNGGVIEILSSGTGRSWTIILTLPSGISCLIAAGENWELIPANARRGPNA